MKRVKEWEKIWKRWNNIRPSLEKSLRITQVKRIQRMFAAAMMQAR